MKFRNFDSGAVGTIEAEFSTNLHIYIHVWICKMYTVADKSTILTLKTLKKKKKEFPFDYHYFSFLKHVRVNYNKVLKWNRMLLHE